MTNYRYTEEKQSKKIHIVDMPMGSGKTCAAINYINNAPPTEKILYVTPYLSETQRILEACHKTGITAPRGKTSKTKQVRRLLSQGKNIVTTHAVFNRLTSDMMDLVEYHGYTLIMDEVCNVIQEVAMTQDDKHLIMEKLAHINADQRVVWDYDEYLGKLEDYKEMCEAGNAFYCETTRTFMALTPCRHFSSFKEVFILTYLFEGQIQAWYYKLNDIDYDNWYVDGNGVDNYKLTKEHVPNPKFDYKNLIAIIDNEKLNRVGSSRCALSATWYQKNKKTPLVTEVKNNCTNLSVHLLKKRSKDILWTTFKDSKQHVSGGGYTKGFASMNLRASNDFRDKDCVFYTINRFLSVPTKVFFKEHGVGVNEDMYALSEMLQFIWRSAIRDGKPISVYVPSKRMRSLLEQWIEDNSYSDGGGETE